MPALCHLTIDQEKKVRDEAFKLLKEFIEKVHKVSENPTVIDELESELETNYNNTNKYMNSTASAWASWAVSSFTSKLTKMSSKQTNDSPTSSSSNSSTGTDRISSSKETKQFTEENNTSKLATKNTNKQSTHSMRLEAKTKLENSDVSDYETDMGNEGWDVDDSDIIDKTSNMSSLAKENRSLNLNKDMKNLKVDKSGWEVEEETNDFGEEKFNDKEKKLTISESYSRSEHSNDKTTVPSIKSLAKPSRTLNKTATKSKTLEDELFQELSEPSTRKKRAGAMKFHLNY